jgi:hypothetical protein
MNTLGAVSAAVTVAGRFGLRCTDPEVLHDGSNVLVHLRPAPVVARVASMTALVRPGVEAWLARDIALTAYLAGRGVPVVAPCTDPPAGPHHHDGQVLTFFEYVPHDPDHRPEPADVAAALADLHAELRGYSGRLPEAGPVDDIRNGLDLLRLDESVLGALRAELAEMAESLAGCPGQPLHGDAHPGNLLATPNGLVWNDFEDTWRGPLAWDLACLVVTGRFDGRAAVAAYPQPPGEEFETCVRLRRLMGVVWRFVLVSRFPEMTGEAERHLAEWLSRRG